MPFICSLSGVIEEDPWGPYATKEELLKVSGRCKGVDNKEMHYQIYTYTPADAVHLAPSDRREVLRRILGVTVPSEKSRVILSILGEYSLDSAPESTNSSSSSSSVADSTRYTLLTDEGWNRLLNTMINVEIFRYHYQTDFREYQTKIDQRADEKSYLFVCDALHNSDRETLDEIERCGLGDLIEKAKEGLFTTRSRGVIEYFIDKYSRSGSETLFTLFETLLKSYHFYPGTVQLSPPNALRPNTVGEGVLELTPLPNAPPLPLQGNTNVPFHLYKRLYSDPNTPLKRIEDAIVGYSQNSSDPDDISPRNVLVAAMMLSYVTGWRPPQGWIGTYNSSDCTVAAKAVYSWFPSTLSEVARLAWFRDYTFGPIADDILVKVRAIQHEAFRNLRMGNYLTAYSSTTRLMEAVEALKMAAPDLLVDRLEFLKKINFTSELLKKLMAEEDGSGTPDERLDAIRSILASDPDVDFGQSESLLFEEARPEAVDLVLNTYLAPNAHSKFNKVPIGEEYRHRLLTDLAIHRWPKVVRDFVRRRITTETELDRMASEVPNMTRYNTYWSKLELHVDKTPPIELVEGLKEMVVRTRDGSVPDGYLIIEDRSVRNALKLIFISAVKSEHLPIAERVLSAIQELGIDITLLVSVRLDYDALSDRTIDWLIIVSFRERYGRQRYGDLFREEGERYLRGLIRAGLVSSELKAKIAALSPNFYGLFTQRFRVGDFIQPSTLEQGVDRLLLDQNRMTHAQH